MLTIKLTSLGPGENRRHSSVVLATYGQPVTTPFELGQAIVSLALCGNSNCQLFLAEYCRSVQRGELAMDAEWFECKFDQTAFVDEYRIGQLAVIHLPGKVEICSSRSPYVWQTVVDNRLSYI